MEIKIDKKVGMKWILGIVLQQIICLAGSLLMLPFFNGMDRIWAYTLGWILGGISGVLTVAFYQSNIMSRWK